MITLYIMFDCVIPWLKQRRGKITASKFGCLISTKGLTDVGRTYLYGLAGEIITGERAEEEFFNDDVSLYAFGDYESCKEVNRKYGWPLKTVKKFQL